MSTTHPTPTDRTFRSRWAAFWFAPGDPTTLGFIRIVTGVLVLYTHLAYSLDLQAFFGKYGWYGADAVERERKEYPARITPFFGWDAEGDAAPRVPEVPHRRAAVMAFIRGLPAGAAERTRALRYLDRMAQRDNASAVAGLDAALRLYNVGPNWQAKVLVGLEEGRQYNLVAEGGELIPLNAGTTDRGEKFFPEYLLVLPEAERKQVADELRSLLTVLPNAKPEDRTAAKYVVMHFAEMDQPYRKALVEYLATLPDDAGERARLTDYLERWNADPRRSYRTGHAITSVWFHVSDPTQMALIHALALAVMALFTLGVCTRVTGVLTWVAAVGYIHRTNQILFGMDTMSNILLLYLVIGNSGAALSVDRLVARYRAARASLRRGGTIDEPTRAFLRQAPRSAGANFGVRLIQVHFCFIYLAAGLAKLKGAGWWNGTAFWDVMVNPEFTLMRYHWFEDMVRSMVSIKPVYYAATALGVWFTWGLEISFPFLVWTRARPVMIWLAVLLHAGIGVLMGLNIFELLMMTMLLVFFPAGVIRDRLRGGPDLPRLGFAFDGADPRQARAAALVAAADVDNQVAVEPKRGRDLPAVTTAAGETVRGPAGVAALFGGLRLLRAARFALYVPGVSGLATRLLAPAAGAPPTANGPRTGPPAPAAAS